MPDDKYEVAKYASISYFGLRSEWAMIWSIHENAGPYFS